MKKKIIVCFISFFFILSLINAAGKNEVPKNVKIISQSCSEYSLFLTVIDLQNNEIVIIEYDSSTPAYHDGKLLNITRTGMFVEPQKVSFFKGSDSPKKINNKG